MLIGQVDEGQSSLALSSSSCSGLTVSTPLVCSKACRSQPKAFAVASAFHPKPAPSNHSEVDSADAKVTLR